MKVNKLLVVAVLGLGLYMYMNSQTVEGFGMGAQAQMASNQGDNTIYGGGGGSQGPLEANNFFGSAYEGQNENITPTSSDQYRMMIQGQGRGSSGVPNYAGMFPRQDQRPVRPIHPPEFTPEIQNMMMMRERQQASNRYSSYRSYHITGIDIVDAILSKVLMFLQQIFEMIIGVLHLLIGWAF